MAGHGLDQVVVTRYTREGRAKARKSNKVPSDLRRHLEKAFTNCSSVVVTVEKDNGTDIYTAVLTNEDGFAFTVTVRAHCNGNVLNHVTKQFGPAPTD